MGVYQVVKADHISAIMVHEPAGDAAQVIEIRNPKSAGVSLGDGFQVGQHYYVSLSLSRTTAPTLAEVKPLPNTVQNELHVAQGRIEQAIGPVSGVVVEAEPEVEAEAEPVAEAVKE